METGTGFGSRFGGIRGAVVVAVVASALGAGGQVGAAGETQKAAAPVAAAGDTLKPPAPVVEASVAADRAFASAHPDAAAVRDELLSTLRQVEALHVGELSILAVQPHHLPLDAVGDGYRLTVPDLSLFIEGDRLSNGTVASEFSLLGPHRLAVRSTIPDKISLLAGDGQAVFEVAIGGRQIVGTWDRRLRNFVALDGEITGIKGMTQGAPVLEIDSVSIKTSSKDIDPGLIDIDTRIEVGGVNFVGAFEMARLTVTSDARRLDIPTFEALQKLTRDEEFMARLQDVDRMDLAEVQALLGERLNSLARPFDSATMSMKAEGMKAADDFMMAGPAAGGGIGGFELGMAVTGVDKNEATVALNFGISGIHVTEGQLPPPVQQSLPRRAGFTISLERVPFAELWGVLMDVLTKGPRDEDTAAAIGGLRAVYPLMRNKAALALRGLAIEGPADGITADGEARIDPASPLLISGDATVVVNNLDGMVEVAKQMGAPPDVMAVTALLTALGEPSGSQGSYRYRIAARPDGQIMVNERPIDPLLEAVGLR